MTKRDTRQVDLFDPVEREAGSIAGTVADIEPIPLLAIPCRFRDRRDAPCRRLATRPVMIDGAPFHHRGRRLLHCDPACYRGELTGRGDDAADGDR